MFDFQGRLQKCVFCVSYLTFRKLLLTCLRGGLLIILCAIYEHLAGKKKFSMHTISSSINKLAKFYDLWEGREDELFTFRVHIMGEIFIWVLDDYIKWDMKNSNVSYVVSVSFSHSTRRSIILRMWPVSVTESQVPAVWRHAGCSWLISDVLESSWRKSTTVLLPCAWGARYYNSQLRISSCKTEVQKIILHQLSPSLSHPGKVGAGR